MQVASKGKLLKFSRRSKLFRLSRFEKGIALLLIVLSAFMLLPLVYIFNHAFKPYDELFVYPPTIWAAPTFLAELY